MSKISPQELAEFAENMSRFMSGGLSVQNAFDAAAASANDSSAANLIKDLKAEMERGGSFADACRANSRYLDEICAAIAEAGEMHAKDGLNRSMLEIARYLEKVKPHLDVEAAENRTETTILETALFLRTLRALLGSSYGLHPALRVMSSNNANEPMRLLSARFLHHVETGESLLDIAKMYPDTFDRTALRLLSLGDGSLELMLVALDRAADYKESLAKGLKSRIQSDDVATFLRRIATVMELKMSLNDALAEAGEDYTYNPAMRELIVALNEKVGVGETFADACAEHPEYFDDQTVQAIAAGEAEGSPANFITLLKHVADQFDKKVAEKARDAAPLATSVFISHSSANREIIEEQLVEPLERMGISCWYSKHAIQSASEWERSILDGLERCEWYLIAMSHEALTSEWVKDELFWAIDNRSENIIPVILDDCDPARFHIRMRRLQVIDLAENYDAGLREIMQAMRNQA
jgi:type II secretory pathway component PulF